MAGLEAEWVQGRVPAIDHTKRFCRQIFGGKRRGLRNPRRTLLGRGNRGNRGNGGGRLRSVRLRIKGGNWGNWGNGGLGRGGRGGGEDVQEWAIVAVLAASALEKGALSLHGLRLGRVGMWIMVGIWLWIGFGMRGGGLGVIGNKKQNQGC